MSAGLLRNIGLLATCPQQGGQGELGLISQAALAWDRGSVVWVGREADLPRELERDDALDAGGRLVVPGLVDCHTHLAFGGWRADEFAQRIAGASYQEIAAAGGGIASTVRHTRAATEADLLALATSRAREMLALGVTTIECKSGYGLDEVTELRLLRVYRALAERGPSRIVSTFLGAHVVPPELRGDRDAYVRLLTDVLIPEIGAARLARCCDAFVEEGAFTVDEARRILRAGQAHGLAAKLHADQLSAGGGAELAAELGALSADHLECVSDAGIGAMAAAGVVAVSLPIATLYLGQRPMPARRLIEAGVPVAVATDFNPGTAPSWHLPLALTLACTLQRMTPAEALKGATSYAARAIGAADRVGGLAVGMAADLAVIDAWDVNQWLYQFRANACVMTVVGGVVEWAVG